MSVTLDLTPLILPLIWTICRGFHTVKKSKQLNVRLPNELREELERACEAVGLDAATVTRACLQAFIDQVATTGEIRLPLAIVPKSKTSPAIPAPTFPSTARAPHDAPSLNESAPTPAAVALSRSTHPAVSPLEKYTRIRDRAGKEKRKP